MTTGACVLVAAPSIEDADLVVELLRSEFDDVVAATEPDRCGEAFDKHRPAVLVLAWKGLEKAQQHYLGLYRRSTEIHHVVHKTVVLCGNDELQRAYELCKTRHFDDYVPFWPMTNDTRRLLMAVHQAVGRGADALNAVPSAREVLGQAQRLFELEAVLERYAAQGQQHIEAAKRLLQQPEPNTADALQPVKEWAGGLKAELASQLDAASALKVVYDRSRPLVLVVEDDALQLKLLSRVLADAGMEPMQAGCAMAALAAVSKRRPDLILMDVQLPDIDGIETTRRLKSTKQLSEVPVIMITAQSEKNVVVESLRAGAADFVVKPFQKQVLLEKLHLFLHAQPPTCPGSASHPSRS